MDVILMIWCDRMEGGIRDEKRDEMEGGMVGEKEDWTEKVAEKIDE